MNKSAADRSFAAQGSNPDNRHEKGLFITFEGIDATIFDSQVAIHTREMREKGVTFEIWTFETWTSHYQNSLQRLKKAEELAQTPVRLFRGVFPYLPFSGLLNALLLLFHLIRYKPRVDFIHARADYAAHVCAYLTFLNIPIIWDCRGDSEAEFLLSYSPANILTRLIRKVFPWLIRWRTFHAARNCAGAIFVSEGLLKRKGGRLKHKNYQIIPCGVSNKLFFFSDALRQSTRKKLGYDQHDRIVIYSGGMAKYQGFPEYVKMFRKLHEQNGNYKFLVATPYLERAAASLHDLPAGSYQLISAPFEEMNALYSASDFGALLRPPSPVNNVASPTKFGEYCLSGLLVIMNDSVEQSRRFAEMLGNLILCDSTIHTRSLAILNNEERETLSQEASRLLSREALADKYLQLYFNL